MQHVFTYISLTTAYCRLIAKQKRDHDGGGDDGDEIITAQNRDLGESLLKQEWWQHNFAGVERLSSFQPLCLVHVFLSMRCQYKQEASRHWERDRASSPNGQSKNMYNQ